MQPDDASNKGLHARRPISFQAITILITGRCWNDERNMHLIRVITTEVLPTLWNSLFSCSSSNKPVDHHAANCVSPESHIPFLALRFEVLYGKSNSILSVGIYTNTVSLVYKKAHFKNHNEIVLQTQCQCKRQCNRTKTGDITQDSLFHFRNSPFEAAVRIRRFAEQPDKSGSP